MFIKIFNIRFFSSEIIQKVRKMIFGKFSILENFPKFIFSLQNSCFLTFLSFHQNIQNPICLFRNCCRYSKKNQKMILVLFFYFSSKFLKSIFSVQKSYRKFEKMILGRYFHFSWKFSKSILSLQKSYRKPEKMIWRRFFNFQQIFQSPFFPFRNPSESPKKWFFRDVFLFLTKFPEIIFGVRNPTENLKRWFSNKFVQHWIFFLWNLLN